jgi:hypothetical protein
VDLEVYYSEVYSLGVMLLASFNFHKASIPILD